MPHFREVCGRLLDRACAVLRARLGRCHVVAERADVAEDVAERERVFNNRVMQVDAVLRETSVVHGLVSPWA